MRKLVLPGFIEQVVSTRFISRQDDLSEFITFERCQMQVFFLGFPAGTHREIHVHGEIRVMLVRSGAMKMTVQDTTRELQAGDMLCLLPNVPHNLEVIGEEPLRLAEFVITQINSK